MLKWRTEYFKGDLCLVNQVFVFRPLEGRDGNFIKAVLRKIRFITVMQNLFSIAWRQFSFFHLSHLFVASFLLSVIMTYFN